jgi:ABC-type bacteriocin/lantibiotic exporter with double-glycine peptidase domain
VTREKTGSSAARWLVPEVVQTSNMDCGPAALKCLLEGHGIPVSYGRLREACQTDVDGTSIDTLEVVANQLGLQAEQVMLPLDYMFLDEARALPAIVVVRHRDGATHFVVVWRRHGPWLQIMDPAVGRRWVRFDTFKREVFHHAITVPATGWREWADADDFARAMLRRLQNLGSSSGQATELLVHARKDPLWFGPAALDASVRFVQSVVDAGGLTKGSQALHTAQSLFAQTHASTGDIFQNIPPKYWSVKPDYTDEDGGLQINLHGAVLVRIAGLRSAAHGVAESQSGDDAADDAAAADAPPPPSPELIAALQEKSVHPLKTIWSLLRQDGILGPWVMGGAMAIAAAVVLVEIMLFRGLFDAAWALNLPSQRLTAMLGLMAFLLILLLIEVPLLTESMRYGRHLDARLRMALLKKLPQLSDRYFQSRPVSDMADRSHTIHMARMVPGFGLQFVQVISDLAFTLIGIALIDSASVPIAVAVTLFALVVPALVQPLLNERDLRVRNHAGALHVFNLDALLGLVPIRTHSAERVVRRQHEGLLVEWARAGRRLISLSLGAQALQSLLCLSLVGYLLWAHFVRTGTANGADLLLVYWALKMPALGQSLITLAQQYPAQRNMLLRLLEPLNTGGAEVSDAAAVHKVSAAAALVEPTPPSTAIHISNGRIVAAGHAILEDLQLHINPGEHVAIVGTSGAGKSTLLGLLLGWHRLAQGTIHIDGTPMTGPVQDALRRHCAWVDPGVQIWNRSLLENLNYACDDESAPRLGEVLDQANLRGVLQKLPQGLQTYLGEGGALLSGGEGQRVRLARALMQTEVRLTLLDEPFRGLDSDQRHQLLKQMLQWWKHSTVLCVTHDVAETLSFKRVLVIDGGRILEDGPPMQLALQPTRYKELLDAEKTVREQMWRGDRWRRVRIDGLRA